MTKPFRVWDRWNVSEIVVMSKSLFPILLRTCHISSYHAFSRRWCNSYRISSKHNKSPPKGLSKCCENRRWLLQLRSQVERLILQTTICRMQQQHINYIRLLTFSFFFPSVSFHVDQVLPSFFLQDTSMFNKDSMIWVSVLI